MNMADRTRLAVRLIAQLNLAHQRCGVDAEPLVGLLGDHEDTEIHELSPCGVLAFVGDYVMAAWPDDEQRVAAPVAYGILWARLRDRGLTRHMVHPLNLRSVKLTRRMGAKPIGVDADGFVHYELTRASFEAHVPQLRKQGHGQENAAPQAA